MQGQKRLRISQGSSNKLISGVSRGDSVEHYPEKERIKLAVFEEKTSSGFRSSPGHAASGKAVCIAPAHCHGHQTS
jgi:hypothetical protein